MALLHRFHACLFLFKVSHITTVIRDKLLVVYFDDTCSNRIDKVSVVRDKKQGKLLFEKHLFKEFDHIDIKVVRWLIQKQDIRFFEDQSSQCHTALFSTRERDSRSVLILFEFKFLQDTFYLIIKVPGIVMIDVVS